MSKTTAGVLNTFMNQWQKDCSLSLREIRGLIQPTSNTRPVKEGEVVILREEGIAKCLWPLSRVTEVINGRDRAIRTPKIQLSRGDRKISLRRPIQHLIPLEIDDCCSYFKHIFTVVLIWGIKPLGVSHIMCTILICSIAHVLSLT